MRQAVKITAVTFLIFVLQYSASCLGSIVASQFDYYMIDPQNRFMNVSVHHIVQMLVAILFIVLIAKTAGVRNFRLKPKVDRLGIIYTLIFCLVLGICYAVEYIVALRTHSISTYGYSLTGTNVLGTLGFQLFLSGPSEEILFRSLPITIYLYVLGCESKKNNWLAIVLAALLFGIAHIDFKNGNTSWFQVGYATLLGIAYGYTFIKSKSVIYPMIMHSMSNVFSLGGFYLYMFLLQNS